MKIITIIIITCFSDTYDDSKESKKSRRQLCSNLFEHLFTQSTESLEQPPPLVPPSSSLSTANETVKPPPTIAPIIPKPQPVAPKLEFASIESFQQVIYFIIYCNYPPFVCF